MMKKLTNLMTALILCLMLLPTLEKSIGRSDMLVVDTEEGQSIGAFTENDLMELETQGETEQIAPYADTYHKGDGL